MLPKVYFDKKNYSTFCVIAAKDDPGYEGIKSLNLEINFCFLFYIGNKLAFKVLSRIDYGFPPGIDFPADLYCGKIA